MSRGQETRNRIMDVTQDAVLAKGFDATSIDEIVEGANLTKSGFFYHFRDKNALALALIERHIAREDQLFDDLLDRAWARTDDPLEAALDGLELLAKLLADMPNGHPGCIVATTVYQDRLFDRSVRDANRRAVLGWRRRFRKLFDDVAAVYPPLDDVDLSHLADMVTAIIEGGIVTVRAVEEPGVTARQVMMLRSYVKLLFSPGGA